MEFDLIVLAECRTVILLRWHDDKVGLHVDGTVSPRFVHAELPWCPCHVGTIIVERDEDVAGAVVLEIVVENDGVPAFGRRDFPVALEDPRTRHRDGLHAKRSGIGVVHVQTHLPVGDITLCIIKTDGNDRSGGMIDFAGHVDLLRKVGPLRVGRQVGRGLCAASDDDFFRP